MANRRKIVAGNWKMNLLTQAAGQLTDDIISKTENAKLAKDVELVLFPPFPYLDFVGSKLAGTTIKYGAQNCSEHNEGAYTGEVSASMICSIGADYVLVGHSERRKYFGEDGIICLSKIKHVLKMKMTPIYCCGEQLEDRNKKNHFKIVESQLAIVLHKLTKAMISKVIIAYEPVWAIGTGETANPKQAQEMHAFIRDVLKRKFGSDVSGLIPILYGGSVNEKNAKNLFKQKDVDGGLVGGASLDAKKFIAIAKSF